MYIYHALINAQMIHINLNMIFYTHVEHSTTKTTQPTGATSIVRATSTGLSFTAGAAPTEATSIGAASFWRQLSTRYAEDMLVNTVYAHVCSGGSGSDQFST